MAGRSSWQAGASEAGRDLAARVADVIFTHQPGLAAAQAFYLEMKERAASHGRTSGPAAATTSETSEPGAKGRRSGGRISSGKFAKPVRAYQSDGFRQAEPNLAAATGRRRLDQFPARSIYLLFRSF
jgi:alkanesulfonate monooxygenase SsuD/methylene tetrahydromethanopterin reductase-like flavin-dependent oxidoreductase (luciferase family)